MIIAVIASGAFFAAASASGAPASPTLADKVAGGWRFARAAPPPSPVASPEPSVEPPREEPKVVLALVTATITAICVVWLAGRRTRPHGPP